MAHSIPNNSLQADRDLLQKMPDLLLSMEYEQLISDVNSLYRFMFDQAFTR